VLPIANFLIFTHPIYLLLELGAGVNGA